MRVQGRGRRVEASERERDGGIVSDFGIGGS